MITAVHCRVMGDIALLFVRLSILASGYCRVQGNIIFCDTWLIVTSKMKNRYYKKAKKPLQHLDISFVKKIK